MLHWLKSLWGKSAPAPSSSPAPWQTTASIYQFLKQNRDHLGALTKSAETLPDEQASGGGIQFAPGLMDAMLGQQDKSEETAFQIRKLVSILSRIARKGKEQDKALFYKNITEEEQVINLVDGFLNLLRKQDIPIDPHLALYAFDLATKTQHRNAVKFGIAILGCCQASFAVEELKILGLHDEFTIFSCIALYHASNNFLQDLWFLAKRVDGWGKIQLVERLAEMNLPEEIRDWLVLEGYKNYIMYQYLAVTCAINGKLDEKLAQPNISPALFTAAGELLEAMIDPHSPAADLSGYPTATSTIQNYLHHAQQQPLLIEHFLLLQQLKTYLEEAQKGEHFLLEDWSIEDFSNILLDIHELLQSKDWKEEAQKALHSENNVQYWLGKQACQQLGLDIWEALWDRLLQNPLDDNAWFDVTRHASPEQAPLLIQQALNSFSLEELSKGPSPAMGMGEQYAQDRALEYVNTFLATHPGQGEPLILAGLQNPVIRTRNFTLKTLAAWGKEHWSPPIQTALEQLQQIEPVEDTRFILQKLLQGQPID